MPRYSREDALSERQLELLFRSAHDFGEVTEFEIKFILVCAGRLGMRSGEIAHIRRDWFDMSTRTIQIPEFDECDFGQHGGHCGYCRSRARDLMDTHNRDEGEIREGLSEKFHEATESVIDKMVEERYNEDRISFEEALSKYWNPKTSNAVRKIPFDFDVRVQLIVEDFVEEYEKFPMSKATINRRVNLAEENSPVDENVYPHSLRATAATMHASRDISPYALMSTMGWASMDTARTYISASGDSAARELRSKYR